MSTAWGIRCVDCNEYGCEQENRGLDWVENVIKCAPALVMLFDLNTHDDLCVMHESGHHYSGWVDLPFIAKHRGHKLVPRDEYGSDFMQCRGYAKCDQGGSRQCALDDGHEGPCWGGRRL